MSNSDYYIKCFVVQWLEGGRVHHKNFGAKHNAEESAIRFAKSKDAVGCEDISIYKVEYMQNWQKEGGNE